MPSIARPPAFFRTRADAAAATIDVTLRTLWTTGYSSAGKGGAKYIRMDTAPSSPTNRGYIRSVDRFTASGATDNTNGGYWQLDVEQGLKVTMFGAAGDNSTSDQTAFEHADAYCNTARGSGVYIPLCIPVGNYVLTAAIQLKQGMHWFGEGHFNEEFEDRARIRNSTTDIFSMAVGQTKGIIFTGICWDGGDDGNLNSFIVPQNLDASEGVLQYSRFAFCGFKNFEVCFSFTGTGVEIHNCYINRCRVIFNIGGSDHFFHDLFMGGNEFADNDQTTYQCTFGTFALSRCEKWFMTGRPQKFFRATGVLDGTFFNGIWFDICQDSAVFLDGGTGGTFIGCSFHQVRLDATPSTGFEAMVRIDTWAGACFALNEFYYDSGDEPAQSPATFEFNGTCSNNRLIGNKYTKGYDRIIDVDTAAGCEYPIIVGEDPMPSLAVANASIVWKPNQSRSVNSLTTLTGNRTLDLSHAGAKSGDQVLVYRKETGAFTLGVRDGVGGSGVKTFASGTAGWGLFEFNGSGWIVTSAGATVT